MTPPVRIEHVTLGASRPSDFAPAYGIRGALTYKGRYKVQCHICGKFFVALGIHVKKTHEMTASDYRFEFGLSHTVGLVSEYLHERYQQGNGQRLKAYASEAAEKAHIAHKALWNDPEWRKRQSERSSACQGGQRIAVKACVICGHEFRVKIANQDKNTTCSKTCSSIRRARQQQGSRWTSEAKAALSRKKRTIEDVTERCRVCGVEYQTAARGSRRSVTCKAKACIREAVRRWHVGRHLSESSKAMISEKARRNFTPARQQHLQACRDLESSKLWQFKRTMTQRAVWRREDVAELLGVSLNHATAILSTLLRKGNMNRTDRGAYRPS